MEGQIRAVAGARILVLGWDLGVGLKLAEALGYSTLVAAEILPDIEAVAVGHMNKQLRGGEEGQ